MLRPGRALLKIRRRFAGGLRAAYFREIVRPRILTSPPVEGTSNSVCEIHVLTSGEDWLNLLWALKSFYIASGRRYALCIHDDGTLSAEARHQLAHHFPSSRIIPKSEADRAAEIKLKNFPRCLAFRQSNHLAPKLFDFVSSLNSDRMLLLDSDVLFFSFPTALIERIERSDYLLNTVNADVSSAYTVAPSDVLQKFGFELIPRFNSGLGLIHKQSIRFDWIEEFLELPGILDHFWRIEQTLFALCSSRYGVELLPDEYRVRITGSVEQRCCRHYVGAVRQLMYREGIAKLVKQRFMSTPKEKQESPTN